MQSMKNIKIWLGLAYLIILTVFLYFFFSKFSIEEITSYNFIKSNIEYLIKFKESNLFLVSIAFISLGILWVSLLQGFASPLILTSGFIFGPYLGTIIIVISLSLGATTTFIFANFFFKDLVKEKLGNKFKFLKEKIQKNQFLSILIYRFIGGIPFQVANLLPILFNVKTKNYFLGTFLGLFPQSFVIVYLGSGLEKQIQKNNTPPSIIELITSSEIYIPILAFFFLIIFAFILRKSYYKN